MARRPEQPGNSTRAVHGGQRDARESAAITTPIYQTATYWFRVTEELKAYQEGRLARDEYGRYGNPTWRAAERKLAALENAQDAVLFASGMCAATTLFLALLPRGAHIVVTSECYRRTRQFIDEYLVKMDVETTVIEPADPKKLADALPAHGRLDLLIATHCLLHDHELLYTDRDYDPMVEHLGLRSA